MSTPQIQIAAGEPLPVLVREPAAVDMIRFAAVAEDFARQHWDKPYMQSLGFPDVIVHGWLTLTYMCQAVTAAFPPDSWRIVKYDARHKQPALPGKIHCGGEITSVLEDDNGRILELAIWARNAEGSPLTVGTMTLQQLP